MLIGAVVHSMNLLEALASAPAGLSVSELSKRGALNKGSIARVLITLQSSGHVLQDPATERYHLSLKTVSIANRYMDRLGFPALIQPVLDDLAAATDELAQLSACDGDRLYVIAKAEGNSRIRIESLLGREIAPHASATGKAWLSALPPQRARNILGNLRLTKLTPHTITDIAALERDLKQARSRGYAVQREELMDHMCAIAVAVRARAGADPVGALVVAAPVFRFAESRLPEIHALLRDAAERIGTVWPRAGLLLSRNAPVSLPMTSDVDVS
jgi:IclR family transcriptional regulator, acetate operon repressor